MEEERTKKQNKPLKKIGDIVFIIFIVLTSVIIALSIFSKETKKPVFKYSIMWVMTGSMNPTIPDRSYILVKKANVEKLEKGDIITFIVRNGEISGEYNTHRISEVVVPGEEFITKGDNFKVNDPDHVYKEDIVYQYVRNLKILTFFGRIYSSVEGLYSTVSLIIIFIVVYSAISMNRYAKKVNRERKQKEIDRLVKEEVKRLEEESKNEL